MTRIFRILEPTPHKVVHLIYQKKFLSIPKNQKKIPILDRQYTCLIKLKKLALEKSLIYSSF